MCWRSNQETSTKHRSLQDLFSALSSCIGPEASGGAGGGGGRVAEVAHLVKEARDLCESLLEGYARSRRVLKDRVARAKEESQVEIAYQSAGRLSLLPFFACCCYVSARCIACQSTKFSRPTARSRSFARVLLQFKPLTRSSPLMRIA